MPAEPGELMSCATPAETFDVALLDLDGVVYVGPSAVPGAIEALGQAMGHGMRLAYVTNNAARTPAEVAEHLCELGLPAGPDDVVTSSQAGAHVVSRRVPPGSPVLAIGGPGVAIALAERGLRPVTTYDEEPVAVMQGFGQDIGWRQWKEASLAVRAGAFWVATNTDRTFPVPGGLAPGNGMMVAAVAAAAGRDPDAIAGKPFAPLMEESVERTRALAPLVVGDRLDTDIEGGLNLGLTTMLVLTGVTDVASLLAAPKTQRPSMVSLDLAGMLVPHVAPDQTAAGMWQRGGARAWVDDDRLVVSEGPIVSRGPVEARDAWEDALRCACAAAWSGGAGVDVEAAARRLEAARPGKIR